MSKETPIQFIRNRTRGIVFGRTRLGDVINALYGSFILIKYSFSNNKIKSKENYRAFLTKQYHIIEKGLSLPSPRQNFGKQKIESLLKITRIYIIKFGEDELSAIIKNCMNEYRISNPNLEEVYPKLFCEISDLLNGHNFEPKGGTKNMNKAIVEKATDIDFQEFVKTRTSIRDFSNKPVKLSDLEKALEIARHAPSVCNRQAWKLHFYDEQKLMERLLIMQAGNSGFTDSIKGLLIVTSDTSQFTKLEGNQVFTDGGLFSMNLLLALHSQGLGSCCLNTCVPYTTEKRIKKVADINTNERLIMMIGIGYLNDNFKSAYSHKKAVKNILSIH